ncbi:12850_t:CDS:2, partial [Racocetra persica]
VQSNVSGINLEIIESDDENLQARTINTRFTISKIQSNEPDIDPLPEHLDSYSRHSSD